MRGTETDLDHYLKELVPSDSPTTLAIAEQLHRDKKWGINIGVVEGQILQWLIRTFNVKSIVEIGTQYGFSTQKMLEALPADGKIVTIEKDPEHHAQAQKMSQDSRVQFLLGDALPILQSITGEHDLIFIDANKNGYLNYLEWSMKHVKKGGLIIGDNTFLFGHVFKDTPPADIPEKMWRTMREFNHRLFSDKSFNSCILPTNEGLTIGYRTL